MSEVKKDIIFPLEELKDVGFFDDDNITTDEKIALLGKDNAIDTSDAFGKYLLLSNFLSSMGEEKANKFMEDTLSMLEDEIDEAFDKLGFDEETA